MSHGQILSPCGGVAEPLRDGVRRIGFQLVILLLEATALRRELRSARSAAALTGEIDVRGAAR